MDVDLTIRYSDASACARLWRRGRHRSAALADRLPPLAGRNLRESWRAQG